MVDISILIPTLESRKPLFTDVHTEILRQVKECSEEISVEVLYSSDN